MIAKQLVPAAFDDVARHYDRLTDLNPGYMRQLLLSAQRLDLEPAARVLDVCCGTGRSTQALRATYPESNLVGLDASPGMLELARARTDLADVQFVVGDASMPAATLEPGFDAILMAYGIRNVPDADVCLRSLAGMLRPGGRLCLHEYALPNTRWHRAIWRAVTSLIIVPLARVVAGDAALFRYLRQSVIDFDTPEQLRARLQKAGLADIHVETVPGWQHGLLHSFVATKRLAA
jgi:ubiquinone/menaquinone biosynthesis methyltransferase